MNYFPLVYLHDPERISFEQATAPDGPVRALIQLREKGRVGHLGVAGGPVDLLRRYLATGEFEALITHNRYTVVDRSAGELIDYAHSRNVAVVNAAVFGGGILVKGPEAAPRYAYRAAPEQIRGGVPRMQEACARHGVPLAAAALQFSTGDRRISATIVGVTRPERIEEILQLAATPIPDALWDELDILCPPRETWLH